MRCLLLMLALLVSPWARAHTLSVSHLDIEVPAGSGDLQVELDLALRDLALSFPLDANRDEQVTWGELQDIQEPLYAWVLADVALSTGPSRCDLKPQGLAVRHYDDGAYATLRISARCPSHAGFKVHYALLFDVDPQHRALVTLRNGPRVDTGIASAARTEVPVGAESSHPFLDFLREGIHHILIGYDHLAFLISLLLPAALVRMSRRWTPATNFRASLMHVLGIVTAFTAAHSITLSLAALGWVTPV
ncbi:MAG TPA: HupE/UreJ family protein, partial [Pseudoxanthomonas sp.]|nr:HupE/UreJ family protein [Pseudoxanthomonas sp.]